MFGVGILNSGKSGEPLLSLAFPDIIYPGTLILRERDDMFFSFIHLAMLSSCPSGIVLGVHHYIAAAHLVHPSLCL